jgi:alkylated DNA repair dioxygenase AlkB
LPETLDLFPSDFAGPPGLRYEAEFITPAEEAVLIGHISALPLQPFQFGAYEGKRRVLSFGWRYDYGERKLKQAEAIPAWLTPFIARIEAFAGAGGGPIGQVLCTEYEKGVGIGWHRDKPHFDDVFGLSLASACKFRFRRQAGKSWERFTLDAEPRSLYAMTGEARSRWEHSIPPVETARYSVTFRTMRGPGTFPPGSD